MFDLSFERKKTFQDGVHVHVTKNIFSLIDIGAEKVYSK